MLLKKTLIPWFAVMGCAVAVLPAGADPFLPVPPASFLNYHVSTARGLSEEVAQDVVVRARLARHFHMSAPAVAEYVRHNLVETTLTAGQAGRYNVACISPSGREYFVSERLAAGTPVFALAATGQPILRLACGNPLVSALPSIPLKPIAKVKPAVLALPPNALSLVEIPRPEVANQTFTLSTPFTTPTIGPVVQVRGVTQSLGGGKGGLFFPILFGTAGVGVLAGHHGSSPPTTPIIPVTPVPPVNTPTAAVPEPSSLLLFSLFGTVVLGIQIRARRR